VLGELVVTWSVSGQLVISGNTLRYAVDERDEWSMPLSELGIVGQCNASLGPFGDGFFLVFVSKDGVPHVAPYYVEGARDFVETLPHIEKPFTLSLEAVLAPGPRAYLGIGPR
jgi:hypothetical protein